MTSFKTCSHSISFLGAFPLSDTSLMTAAERRQFLPVVRSFTNILEKGNASPSETNQLLTQIRTLNELIPANMRANIEQITGLATSGFGGANNNIANRFTPSVVTRTQSVSSGKQSPSKTNPEIHQKLVICKKSSRNLAKTFTP